MHNGAHKEIWASNEWVEGVLAYHIWLGKAWALGIRMGGNLASNVV